MRQTRERCFNCEGKDHEKKDCPNKDKGRRCYNCQGYGHLSAECPERGRNGPIRVIAQVNWIENWDLSEQVNQADGHERKLGRTTTKIKTTT